jgi:hypothetical protein
MEFLQTNWVWLLLVVGALWLLFRGGLGCGRGRRDSGDRARHADGAREGRELEPRESTPREGTPRAAEHAGHRGHRGC